MPVRPTRTLLAVLTTLLTSAALVVPLAVLLGAGPSFVGASASAQRQDSTAWWALGRQGRQQAGDCGIWVLDSRGYCVADDRRNGLEVGVRFRTSSPVLVTGIRLYRVDPSQLRVSLWDQQGNRIGSGLVTAGVANGWTDVAFDSPVQVGPGATYTASYFSPRTMYAFEYGFFADRTMTEGPVTALAHTEASPNGVHCYDDAVCGSYPVRGHRQSNYWISPLWQRDAGVPGPSPTPTRPPGGGPGGPGQGPTPTPGASKAAPRVVGWQVKPRSGRAQVRIRFSEPLRASSVKPRAVRLLRGNGAAVKARLRLSKNAAEVTLTPTASLRPATSYRVVVTTRVRDAGGDRLDQQPKKPGRQDATWNFKTRGRG